MSRKKRGVRKCNNNFQYTIDPNISWSTSDSDCEKPPKTPKTTDLTSVVDAPLTLEPTSPIIDQFTLSRMSPNLSQFQESFLKKSPIITRRKVLRRKRRVAIIEESPEQTFTQLTCIIDSNSPIGSSETNYKIEEIDSSNTPVVDSTPESSTSLYHNLERPRGRVKKGGFAAQLYKALDAQAGSQAIWEHEQSLGKCEDIPHVEFCVTDTKMEYNCKILQCRSLSSCDDYKLDSVFIIILGFNNQSKDEFQTGTKWKLFEPFERRTITYKNAECVCFTNSTRMVKIKA